MGKMKFFQAESYNFWKCWSYRELSIIMTWDAYATDFYIGVRHRPFFENASIFSLCLYYFKASIHFRKIIKEARAGK